MVAGSRKVKKNGPVTADIRPAAPCQGEEAGSQDSKEQPQRPYLASPLCPWLIGREGTGTLRARSRTTPEHLTHAREVSSYKIPPSQPNHVATTPSVRLIRDTVSLTSGGLDVQTRLQVYIPGRARLYIKHTFFMFPHCTICQNEAKKRQTKMISLQ